MVKDSMSGDTCVSALPRAPHWPKAWTVLKRWSLTSWDSRPPAQTDIHISIIQPIRQYCGPLHTHTGKDSRAVQELKLRLRGEDWVELWSTEDCAGLRVWAHYGRVDFHVYFVTLFWLLFSCSFSGLSETLIAVCKMNSIGRNWTSVLNSPKSLCLSRLICLCKAHCCRCGRVLFSTCEFMLQVHVKVWSCILFTVFCYWPDILPSAFHPKMNAESRVETKGKKQPFSHWSP